MKAGNRTYAGPGDLPVEIPVFPLPAALLLPGGEMPLNIFEPRYIAMIDEALATDRIIGMIQPKGSPDRSDLVPDLFAVGCAGRITGIAESGDGRYLLTLVGIARFRVVSEVPSEALFRRCRVSFDPFVSDFADTEGGNAAAVDRIGLLRIFRQFLDAKSLKADWETIDRTPTGALVNALAMMSPYGLAEKQALLEAPDIRSRAETLVAITEADLARGTSGKATLN